MNIFERATRRKLRYPSEVGDLTTEQLWDLPLKARRGPDLDTVARGIYMELKDIGEASFVDERPDPRKTELELQLEVVKHVIESKKAEATRAEKVAATAERKRKLLDALAAKDDQALAGMSREDIEKEIAGLGVDEPEVEAA